VGLAISTKLLPLIVLPLVVRWLGWRKGILFALISLGITIALFLPFASLELVQHVFSSINLYFQKFEFNASVYYLFRWVGFRLTGYNAVGQIGPMLSISTLIGILWLSWRKWSTSSEGASLPGKQLVWILSLYFALATTVHPWYITTLVAASVFSGFRYPLVWSGMAILSYATYQTVPYRENLWFTAFEYGVVLLVAIREWQAPNTEKGFGFLR
jgi:hypothetical protein